MIPQGISVILLMTAVAFGGSTLLSAYEGQFEVLVPSLALWIAYRYFVGFLW